MFTWMYSQRAFANLCLTVNTIKSNSGRLKENSCPQCMKASKRFFFKITFLYIVFEREIFWIN